ncbi:MAG: hypothetical protein JSV03_14100, partial [Planctomycetota bacterium]
MTLKKCEGRTKVVLWIAALVGFVVLWLTAVSLHIKLLLAIGLTAVGVFKALEYWSRSNAQRRRVFFILLLSSPVVILTTELAYSFV